MVVGAYGLHYSLSRCIDYRPSLESLSINQCTRPVIRVLFAPNQSLPTPPLQPIELFLPSLPKGGGAPDPEVSRGKGTENNNEVLWVESFFNNAIELWFDMVMLYEKISKTWKGYVH